MKSKKIKSKKPKNLIKDSSSSTKIKFIISLIFLFIFLIIVILLRDGIHPVEKIIYLVLSVVAILRLIKIFKQVIIKRI